MGQTVLVFGLATLLVLCLTPLVRRFALRVGAVDRPVARSMHTEPKPFLGGLAIYAAFATTLIGTGGLADRGTRAILVGGLLIVLLGVVDDCFRLSAKVKFLGQVAVAAVFVIGFGQQIQFVFNPLQERYISLMDPPWLAPLLTIFWVVAVINVINIVDGLDGLAAGISTIASLTLLIVAVQQGDLIPMMLTAALAGSALGFLRYNFNPAKIFMGDAGAMFLGFALAATAVTGVMKSAAAVGVAVPVLALGLPIMDTFFAILRRLLNGRSIGEADKDHLHHRLIRRGLSHKSAVLVMWGVSAAMGASAILIAEVSLFQGLLITLATWLTVVLGAVKSGVLVLRSDAGKVKEH